MSWQIYMKLHPCSKIIFKKSNHITDNVILIKSQTINSTQQCIIKNKVSVFPTIIFAYLSNKSLFCFRDIINKKHSWEFTAQTSEVYDFAAT